MKKFFCLLSITILSIAIFSYKSININADTNNANIEIKAPVGLLIEYSTGEVIFEKNADEKMYPASMTKMIGLYLILESLESGDIKFEDVVSVSANAASMGGAQVFLQPGEKISVEDLFKSVAIVSANYVNTALAFTSSHNATAERQFRYPNEYGIQKKPTTTSTVTGAGAIIVSNTKSDIKVTSATFGEVVDYDFTNVNDLGTAMAPAAYKTIKQHLSDRDIETDYYDLILTGDLSKYGKEVLIQMFKTDNIDISKNYDDCGLLIYDIDKQPVFAGGSGCACCAVTTFGYILDKLRKKELTKVLVVATGALHSATIVQQKESIVSIAHAVSLEVVNGLLVSFFGLWNYMYHWTDNL